MIIARIVLLFSQHAGGCKPVSVLCFFLKVRWLVLQAKLYSFKGGSKMVMAVIYTLIGIIALCGLTGAIIFIKYRR